VALPEFVLALPLRVNRVTEPVPRWEHDARLIGLVRKARPDWQRGRLNLPGGRLEPGEDPAAAMERELREETGLVRRPELATRVGGVIRGPGRVIHCGVVPVPPPPAGRRPPPGGDEPFEWYPWARARVDPDLIPNLRVVVPLLLAGVAGWEIWNDSGGLELRVVLPTLPDRSPSPGTV
jgi:8-oxo-dGTP pyrophosphatase MutT (NUDIX family)